MNNYHFEEKRNRMVENQIKARGIKDRKILDAFRNVKRHKFISDSMKPFAYEDRPLRIGKGQTISQPYMIAMMISLLDLKEDEVVLEIGTGSGYQTALLAEICKKVYSIERILSLAETAREKLHNLEYDNIEIQVSDGSTGWSGDLESKFDGIIVAASAPEVPDELVEQLANRGRLVIPVGSKFSQDLIRVVKTEGKIKKENYGGCVFVPLLGEGGWKK